MWVQARRAKDQEVRPRHQSTRHIVNETEGLAGAASRTLVILDMILAVARRSATDLVLDILARLFNACIGAVLGLSCGVQPRGGLVTDDLLPVERPTALAIIVCAGALIGLIWGKNIWSLIDRRFGGWGSRRDGYSDDANGGGRRREKGDL